MHREIKPVFSILPYFLIFGIAVFGFRNVLFKPGVLQFYVDWDWPPYNEQLIIRGIREFYLWKSMYMGFSPMLTSTYLFTLSLAVLAFLGFDSALLSKVFLCVVYPLAGISFYRLTRQFGICKSASFVAAVSYMLSPVVFTKLLWGQLGFFLSYCLSPLAFLLFINSVKNDKIDLPTLATACLLFGIVAMQIQFIVMISFISLSYLFFNWSIERAKSFVAILLAGLLIHAPWIIVFLTSVSEKTQELLSYSVERSITHANKEFTNSLLVNNSANLLFRIIALATNPGEWGTPHYLWVFCGIFLVIFSFLPLLKPNKNILFAAFIALVGLFFYNAMLPGMAGLSQWIYSNLIFMKMFRELDHIAFLVVFGYSLLLGFFSNILFRLTKKTNRYLLLLLVMIGLYNWPLLTGDMAGYAISFVYPHEYRLLFNRLADDPEDYRVMWIGSSSVVKYLSDEDTWKEWARDPMIAYLPKDAPQTYDMAGTDSQRYGIFLTKAITRTRSIGYPLGLANIKYLLYREGVSSLVPLEPTLTDKEKLGVEVYHIVDPAVLFASKDRQLIAAQKDIKLDEIMGRIEKYENKNYRPHLYASSETAIAAGDLSTYLSLSEIGETPDLIFTSQLRNSTIMEKFGTFIIKDEFELLLPYINTVEICNYANKYGDYKQGWARSYRWFNFGLKWDYILPVGCSVITTSSDILEIPLPAEGEQHIWAKCFFGNSGSKLEFYADGSKINEINTRSSAEEFKWVYIGKVVGNRLLTINSSSGENVIARLAFATESELNEARQNLRSILGKKNILIYSELEKVDVLPHGGSVMKLFGASQGEVLYLNSSTRIVKEITIPIEGWYSVRVRGSNILRISTNGMIKNFINNTNLTWYDMGSPYFEKGTVRIEIETYDDATLDMVVLEKNGTASRENTATISSERITPTLYRVRVNVTKPFLLVFSENYDDHWVAKCEGCDFQHIKVNSFANGWYVNKTGDFEIGIEHKKQKVYSLGLFISIATLLIISGFVAFTFITKLQTPRL